jgi:hypothetical protein
MERPNRLDPGRIRQKPTHILREYPSQFLYFDFIPITIKRPCEFAITAILQRCSGKNTHRLFLVYILLSTKIWRLFNVSYLFGVISTKSSNYSPSIIQRASIEDKSVLNCSTQESSGASRTAQSECFRASRSNTMRSFCADKAIR